MPTFIKTGFWEKTRKGYKEWLNLDQFVESKVPTPPYKVYTALVSQNSGSAPEVNVVLQDTINETFTFTYINQGLYQISSPIFNPENFLKTSITLSQSVEQRVVSIQSNTLDSGYVSISCQGLPVGAADDGIYFATLEIRIYN